MMTTASNTAGDVDAASTAFLVFSDLDGTLLDHDSYSHAAAQPAIDLLDVLAIPLVFVSSKTRAEVVALRRRLANGHPFVVENGAAVFIPEGYFLAQPAGTVLRDGYWVRELAAPRARWVALLEQIAADFPGQFEYFARAGEAGIAAMTGLSEAKAALANAREYSEPVQWRGDRAGLDAFLAACAAGGARVSRGGRFYSLGGEADKGEALRWLRKQFAMARGIRHIKDLAAGDGANDVPMLESAETALLVRAPDRDLPPLQRAGGVLCSDAEGPAGWAEGVTQWLCEHGLVTQDS
ncbi:HAD-IIB family hydrolase [Pseudohaliea rubra]|uniref:Putative mannosyl-3-phosphoglycerate phosphatase n=1 Tax=Pseudohaliea rubra DSM 19751 TaxID=1265313 RepID=A0A095X1L2_9GAMM|nr:HAD-IIB family hydrolase [Pseudohaliea rubra]KGE04754.1 putative mannosyl-3-phosphoglycerate phosphatase [Pseudohaliea rubra DSM 19751]